MQQKWCYQGFCVALQQLQSSSSPSSPDSGSRFLAQLSRSMASSSQLKVAPRYRRKQSAVAGYTAATAKCSLLAHVCTLGIVGTCCLPRCSHKTTATRTSGERQFRLSRPQAGCDDQVQMQALPEPIPAPPRSHLARILYVYWVRLKVGQRRDIRASRPYERVQVPLYPPLTSSFPSPQLGRLSLVFFLLFPLPSSLSISHPFVSRSHSLACRPSWCCRPFLSLLPVAQPAESTRDGVIDGYEAIAGCVPFWSRYSLD